MLSHVLVPLLVAGLAMSAGAQITLLKDIRAGRNGSFTGQSASTGDFYFFSADDGVTGNSLWVTKGSPAATYQLKTTLKDPKWLTAVGRLMLFSADDGTTGDELWVSDGTSSGTRNVVNLMPGKLDSTRVIVAAHKGVVFFFADSIVNNRNQLGFWRSDGTAAGTFQLKAGNLGLANWNLWRSVSFGPYLYFWSLGSGGELWRTDGTVSGTTQVFTFNDRAKSITPLVAWNGRLWCDVVQNAKHELWTSDGTSAGTTFFRAGYANRTMSPAGGVMYFSFATSGTGLPQELWKTDGTVAGTTLVSNQVFLVDGTPGVSIGNGSMVFAGASNNAVNPWVTDGTSAGTLKLSPVPMAVTVSFTYNLLRIGDGAIVAFHGWDAQGQELWVTDGTPQNTKLVIDFWPGFQSGLPNWSLARTGETYVFCGDDGMVGRGAGEPFAVSLTWFGAAFNEPYGTGCAGSNGVPTLRGVGGAPTLGNSNFALEIANGAANATAVLGISPRPDNIQLGPCTLLIQISSSILEGKLFDAQGQVRVPVAVPNNPSLIGINVYWQAIVIDPKGSLLKQFALSNGLRTLVGK